jgi:SAM-dependent methyltransferase
MTVFGDYSKYYDLLYSTKEYSNEVNFVDLLLAKYSKKSIQSLLELGSGTGKHALHLAQKGYQIDGVDLSHEMLEMAGKFLSRSDPSHSSRVSLSQADIRTLRNNKQYDAAISLFHVMSYQTTNEDLKAVFQTVKEHVHPGGVFIFDCWYGPAALTQLPEVRHKRFENEHGVVERVAVPTLNVNDNTIEVHYHLFVQEKGTDTFYKIEERHLMRYLFMPEIKILCAEFGMKLEHACEWLTGKTLNQDTWGACFVVSV